MCCNTSDCETHFMKLYDGPFELIKSGKKNIEVRCCDDKRRQIKVGDKIVFCRDSDHSERICTQVTGLKQFSTFKELYEFYPIAMFGCDDKSVEEMLASVNKIYSKEKQQKYGALAIELSLNSQE